jgi:chitinase
MIFDVTVILFNQAQYVKDNGLGGAMIWSVETDDFLGVCGDEKFPLLVAINSVLTGKTSGIQVRKQCCL